MAEQRRFAFSKTRLEKLAPAPPGKRVVYYDTTMPHLCLSVTATGTKTFYLYRKIDGRPERFTIGRFPAVSVEKAQTQAEHLNGRVADRANPQAMKRALKGELTLGALFETYVDQHLVPRGKHTRTPRSLFNTHFADWADRKLSKIKATDVQKRHAEIGTTRPAAANRAVQLLRAMYNRAIYWGHFEDANPALRIERFPETARKRFLHPDEMAAFLGALGASPPTFRDFILMCLFTGARRSNVQTMRWADIHFERAVWSIPITKSGDPHQIPLVREALGVLQHRRRTATAEWVFPGESRSGHYQEPTRAWRSLLERAGIEDLHIHDLRRTVGSWLAAEGTSLPIIGETLGHKSPASTAIYARLSLDPVRASLEAVIPKMLAAGDKPGDDA